MVLGIRQGMLGARGSQTGGTGLCGGFTTFSAFALDNVVLLRSGANTTAVSYTIVSLVLGILLCYAGYQLSHSAA